MFKKDKSENNLENQAVVEEPDVPAQLKKISDHLVFLEKKLDTILAEMKSQKPQGQRFENRNFPRRPGQYRPEGRPGQYNRPEGRPGYYQGSGNQGPSGPHRSHRPSGHSRPYENRPRTGGNTTEGNFQKKFSH